MVVIDNFISENVSPTSNDKMNNLMFNHSYKPHERVSALENILKQNDGKENRKNRRSSTATEVDLEIIGSFIEAEKDIKRMGMIRSEKWEWKHSNPIHSVAIVQNLIVWSTPAYGNGKYAHVLNHECDGHQPEGILFWTFFSSEEGVHEVPNWTHTRGVIHSFDFDNPKLYPKFNLKNQGEIEIAAIDSCSAIYLFSISPNLPIKYQQVDGDNEKLLCVSFQRHKPEGSGCIVVGTNNNEACFFETGAFRKIGHRGTVSLQGKCLDTEIIPVGSRNIMDEFHVVLADDTYGLTIYNVTNENMAQFDFESTNCLYSGMMKFDGVEPGNILSISDDRGRLAIACEGSGVIILQNKTLTEQNSEPPWEQISDFELPTPRIVCISNDGHCVALAHGNCKVIIYDIDMECQTHSFDQSALLGSLALAQSHLLTGSSDGKITLYDISGGFEPKFQIDKGAKSKGIRSVSLHPNGKKLALSLGSGQWHMYTYDEKSWVENDEGKDKIFVCDEKRKEILVKFSPDGKLLALADLISGAVQLVFADQKQCMLKLPTKYSTRVLDFDFKQKYLPTIQYVLAVACKGHKGDYVSISTFVADDSGEIIVTKRKKLSFPNFVSLSFSVHATVLAVVVKGGKVLVHNTETILRTFLGREEISTVALSPNGIYIAFNENSHIAKVSALQTGKEMVRLPQTSKVRNLEFANENLLGIITENGRCTLYDLETFSAILSLKYGKNSCNSFSFTEMEAFAVAHDNIVTLYGHTSTAYGVRDRPSFNFICQKLIKDPESFQVAINNHPSLVNIHDGNYKSLLHFAIENGTAKAIDILLLKAPLPLGLFVTKFGNDQDTEITALSMALKHKDKSLVDKLLTAINSRKIVNTPKMFEMFFKLMMTERGAKVTVLEELGDIFPDLLLKLFHGMKLKKSHRSVLGKLREEKINCPFYVGIPSYCPANFWYLFFNQGRKEGRIKLTHNTVGKYLSAVEAFVIPMGGICGTHIDSGNGKGHWVNPLEIVVNCSRHLQDISVFEEDTAIFHLVKYKWDLVKGTFKRQFLVFLVYLFLSILTGWGLVNTLHLDIRQTYHNKYGRMALILSPFVGLMSMWYLFQETRALYSEFVTRHYRIRSTLQHYYIQDPWNLIDLLYIVCQIMTDVCLCTKPSNSVSFASISSVALVFKVLYFARGFKEWGPCVRMIQRVIYEMEYFMVVLLIVLAGFSFGFHFMYHDEEGFSTPFDAFLEVTLMVYGEFNDVVIGSLHDWRIGTYLFEVFLYLVEIILLTLLIAIMTDAYTEVQRTASEQTMMEQASIILEIETKAASFRHCNSFSKWVHVLKPFDCNRQPISEGEKPEHLQGTVHLQRTMEEICELLKKMDRQLSCHHELLPEWSSNEDNAPNMQALTPGKSLQTIGFEIEDSYETDDSSHYKCLPILQI